MIKKFEDYIKEGLWSKGIERSKSGDLRGEQGKKVMTSLGVEIVLHNTNYDYEQLIKDIINEHPDDPFGIDFDYIGNFKESQQRALLKDEQTYGKLIDKSTVACFDSYEALAEDTDAVDDGLLEDDYINIINGITDALKKINIQKLPRHTQNDSNHSDYAFLLLGEDDVYYYECELNENTLEFYFDDFKNYFQETFPDAGDLIIYSYANYSCGICVQIDYDNLLNYQKMKTFVEDYYKGLKDMYDEEDDEE